MEQQGYRPQPRQTQQGELQQGYAPLQQGYRPQQGYTNQGCPPQQQGYWGAQQPSFRPEPSGESYFDGTVLEHIGQALLAGLITAVTLGICYPWALCKMQAWKASHTVLDGRRLSFEGKPLQLFKQAWWLWWLILAAIFAVDTLLLPQLLFGTINSGSIQLAQLLAGITWRLWLWYLLYAVTLGGYLLWLNAMLKRWVTQCTHYAQENWQ